MADDMGEFLLERYRNGEADPDEIRELEEQLEADPQLRRKLVKDVLQDLSLYRVCGETKSTTDRPGIERRSTRLQSETQPTGTRSIIYACAAAAALLVTTGLVALWLMPEPLDRPLTRLEQRRKQIIIEQLHELNLERKAIETARARPKPVPPPGSPPPDAPVRVVTQREAEEGARFIEARRRFVMQQLRVFHGRGPLPDDLDVEEFEPLAPVAPDEPIVAETGPVQVGRVLLAEGNRTGVLIREADEGSRRLALRKGLALLSGDRIETAHGTDVPCASVRLDGGATLDLDRDTSVELLGRDNLRFRSGRIYAHISVPYPEDSYAEEGPPFSLQTEAGRFLTHDLQAELYLSPHEVLSKDLRARVDNGKVHLVNHKGHTVGRKGQELRARKDARPSRAEGFSAPVWRGRGRHYPNLPFGRSSPIILSSYKAKLNFSENYAMAMALRREISLAGLQASRGRPDQVEAFHQLAREAQALRRFGADRIPAVTLGALKPLTPAPSGELSHSRAEQSSAARQIVAQARTAKPSQPLVVFCHSTVTDVAAAWLMDQSITKRIVVVLAVRKGATDWMWYTEDPTAGEIVMRHFRCVIIRGDDVTIDPARLERIADPRWTFLRDRTANGRKLGGLLYVTNPDPGRKVRRVRFAGFDKGVKLEPDPKGNVWEVLGQTALRDVLDEFDRIFLAPAR